jgi:hypothetical protein
MINLMRASARKLIMKAAGAPQHLTFLCVPKEKSAKERAPC